VLEAFLIKPFFTLILIVICCSLLGVFILWKKLSYFGDAFSHSILLGLVLSLILQTNQIATLLFFAVIFAVSTLLISQNRYFSRDTIIMILSYFFVALALIFNDMWAKNFYLTSYVFGDVLTSGDIELQTLGAITIITVFYMIFAFNKTLLINISADLAEVEGIKSQWWNLSFLILLAAVIALSVKIVGVFLMTALLILPAAIARIFSVSAKQMLMLSLTAGISVCTFSFKIASYYDLATGPTIIAIFVLIFLTSLIIKTKLTGRR
jgi:zinc transport system permease protein